MPKVVTEAHKFAISKANKGRKPWCTGKKLSREHVYKNMAAHLRFSVDYKWLLQFEDLKKLKFLNLALSKRGNRNDVSTEFYKAYIIKFYEDEQFNLLYNSWLKDSFNKYKKPSIDHIIPVSRGGKLELDNMQFLTWFENRCKNNMSEEDWINIKNNIGDYFV